METTLERFETTLAGYPFKLYLVQRTGGFYILDRMGNVVGAYSRKSDAYRRWKKLTA